MPLSRQQKTDLVAGYGEGLAGASSVFLLGYQGVTVPQVTDLRARVRHSGGHYVVVKNTLVLRAIGEGALSQLKDHFTGATAVAYSEQDPVALAKALTDFAKEVPAIEFKAGLIEGRPVRGEEVKAIAQLPSRQELVAKLLWLLQSPISRLVRTMAAVPRQLVLALDQVRRQREGAS